MTQERTPLLPCPFCGADAARLRESISADMSWVSCIVCGLEAPTETGVKAEQAVDYWNSRPASSSQAEIARLRLALEQIAGVKADVPAERFRFFASTTAALALSEGK